MKSHLFGASPIIRLWSALLCPLLAVAAVEKPVGTFASAGAGQNPSDPKSVFGDAQLRGVLIRASWETLEASPGQFSFASLGSQIGNVKSRGLSWSLAVLGGGIGSPAWLTAPAGEGGLGAPYINYSFRGVPGYRLPLFWDATVQARLQILAQALAAQFGGDPALKLVYVTQMTANGIEGHLQGVNMGDLVAAGYTDQKWVEAGKQAARGFADAFVDKAIAFEVHNVNGGATVPQRIINDLWVDPALGQRVGAAMWWISGRTNYQADLLAVLMDYPGDLYGQVIANSSTPSEFLNGDYATVFAQARQLGMRYIEPWDHEFTDTSNSSHRRWEATFAEFNAWADTAFAPNVVAGEAVVVGARIAHPNGNIYDQALLTGPSATLQASPGRVLRCSFLDSGGDIVQCEFAGPGSLTVTLDPVTYRAAGPAALYNQPGVSYVTGRATLVIDDSTAETFVSVFTVGRATAVNQGLFPEGQGYDGVADVQLLRVNGTEIGGVLMGNTRFGGASGETGILAPATAVRQRLVFHELRADGTATPLLRLGAGSSFQQGLGAVLVAGGGLVQPNGAAIDIASATGPTELVLVTVANIRSDGSSLPRQSIPASVRWTGGPGDTLFIDGTPVAVSPRPGGS